MKEGFGGDFYLAAQHKKASERIPRTTHTEALQDVRAAEVNEHLENRCIERLAGVIAHKLLDPVTKQELRAGTGPAYAEVQNILTSYVLKNGCMHDENTRAALTGSHEMEHARTLLAAACATRRLGEGAASVVHKIFAHETLSGVESMTRYVLAREKELAEECACLGTEQGCEGRMYYRILTNAFLDAAHEVDAVEMVYETGERGVPAKIHRTSLVQVKSPGFVLNTAESADHVPVLLPAEDIKRKCESVHRAHEGYIQSLAQYPVEALLGAHDREEFMSHHERSKQAARTIVELFTPSDTDMDTDAAWALVEEARPDSGAEATTDNIAYFEFIWGLLERKFNKRPPEGGAVKGVPWCAALLGRISERLMHDKAELLHRVRGVGAHDMGVRLPEHIASVVRVGKTAVSTQSLSARATEGNAHAVLYRDRSGHTRQD